jgi:Bacterial HORMA domain family 1
MSHSYTISQTESTIFTVTHARHMAAKVATDLKRMQRLYGKPSDFEIAEYESEITEFLKEGFLGTVTYGYRRDGNWVEPTLRYAARDLAGSAANDDDPGRVRVGANIDGATFQSYLTYSQTWDRLSDTARNTFRKRLPFTRKGAPEPGVSGYLADDKIYSSGGRALNRASVRSFG